MFHATVFSWNSSKVLYSDEEGCLVKTFMYKVSNGPFKVVQEATSENWSSLYDKLEWNYVGQIQQMEWKSN